MNRRQALGRIGSTGIVSALGALGASPAQAKVRRAPNIVIIVADDLGFSDLGAFGGDIRTPNLDRLARSGLRLSNFHVAPACSPTRAMLLTGVDHHRAGFGTFSELIQPNQVGRPGYEGRIADGAVCIARRLAAVGYRTMMSGKWHLGEDPRADPARQGFARSFALIPGGHNHFGMRRDGKPGIDSEYREDGQRVASLPADFYSSNHFTDKLIGYIQETGPDPFFAYLAFTAPHYPLQAPPEDIARYRGRYDDGYAALRRRRLRGLSREGLLRAGAPDEDDPGLAALWAALSDSEKATESRKMEVFAAMVDRLDQNVGRLIGALSSAAKLDDTVFLFLSDNGAEGTELEHSAHHSAMGEAILRGADNSLESIGTARSYCWYGPGWARASSAPFRLFKHFPTEGGIRVPAFVSGAGIVGGSVSDAYAFVTDIAPTLIDWAHAPHPKEAPYFAYRGTSLRPLLEQRVRNIHDDNASFGWELWGRRAYRRGRWKAVLIPPPEGTGRWALYDIIADPGERHDLAEAKPRILASMVRGWHAYARSNGVVLPTISGL